MQKNGTLSGATPMSATPAQIEQVKQKLVGEQFDGKFQQALEERYFPEDSLSPEWIDSATQALEHASLLSLGVDAPTRKALTDALTSRKINLFQFATLNNNLEIRTPRELGLTEDAYLAVMEESNVGARIWNEITVPLRKEVSEAIYNSINLKQAPEPKPVGEFGNMAPVK